MTRVLILKFGAIGDVVMALPAVHALHLAGYRVDWVCGAAVLPLLRLYPWVHPVEVDDRALLTGSLPGRCGSLLRLWSALRRGSGGLGYDLIATLYYDRRYRLLTLPLRAARRIRLSHRGRGFELLPGRHHTDEFARILLTRPDRVNPCQLAPVPLPAGALPRCTLPASGRTRVVLAPAGAKNMLADDALRRWPAENYVELARELILAGMEVVLIGGPGDGWVQPLFAGVSVDDQIGRLALPETLAVLESAAVTVTHDTGPLHLAGITGTGIVAVFGPTDPRGRLPQRPGTVALWGGEGFACRPCYDGRSFAPCPANDCMRQITVAMVLAEIQRMLEDRRRGYLGPPRVVVPASAVAAGVLTQIEGARL